MNKFTTKLTALALLLAGGSQCAWAEDAETDYHFSFDKDSVNHFYDDNNTYDANTKTFTIGLYGQVGWDFTSSPKDFSSYNYAVIKFAKVTSEYVEFRMYNNSDCQYLYRINGLDTTATSTTVIVPLKEAKCTATSHADSAKAFNASSVKQVYFWSYGASYSFDDLYLTSLYKPEHVAIQNYSVLDSTYTVDFTYDETGTAKDDTDTIAYGNYCSYTYASKLYETSYGSTEYGNTVGNNGVQFHLSEAIDISGYDSLVIELDSAANISFMPALDESTTGGYSASNEISFCKSGSTTYTIALDTCAYTGTKVGTVVIMTEYDWWSTSGGHLDFKSITFVNEKGYYYSDGYYARKAGDGVYGTICLPYAAVADSATVYEVVGYGATTGDDGNETPSELYLDAVDSLEAGVAYVFLSSANDSIVTFTLTGDSVEAATGNALVGTYSKADVGDSYYILTTSTAEDGTVSYVWGKGEGNSVGAHKAYLNLSSSVFTESTTTTEAKANGWISMSLAYDGDDGTTGIKEIVSEEEDASDDDAIYNLSGVRVTNPQKGIYIKNGKKYIIK